MLFEEPLDVADPARVWCRVTGVPYPCTGTGMHWLRSARRRCFGEHARWIDQTSAAPWSIIPREEPRILEPRRQKL